jgi:hypothetical protein
VSQDNNFISHYTIDTNGRRTLVGLSFEETTEFEQLDARLPYNGKAIWPAAAPIVPLLPMEVRWLELYRKHRAAFDVLNNRPA